MLDAFVRTNDVFTTEQHCIGESFYNFIHVLMKKKKRYGREETSFCIFILYILLLYATVFIRIVAKLSKQR